MPNPPLTYLVNTRSKLPALREAMAQLLPHVRADEEVVVVDGGSNDGSVEYLQELERGGRIQRLLSESDRGEAHGLNKGMLLARGDLIKIITDDDVYHYPTIRKCLEFMLTHEQYDLLGTDGAQILAHELVVSYRSSHHTAYRTWLKTRTPFGFSGLGMMIRRSSLPVLGLFNTAYAWVDMEYAYRQTSGIANIAWYSGYSWLRVLNSASNTLTQATRIDREGRKLDDIYLGRSRRPAITLRARAAGRLMSPLRKVVASVRAAEKERPKDKESLPWPDLFLAGEQWLSANASVGEFIQNGSSNSR